MGHIVRRTIKSSRAMKKTPKSNKDAVWRRLRRLVLGPWWWVIARRNVARWWWQEYQRYQRSHWVLHWMTEAYGPADCMLGERSWRIGGILCTIWLGPMRLKVYHDGGKACRHFELTDPADADRAMNHVRNLPENDPGQPPADNTPNPVK